MIGAVLSAEQHTIGLHMAAAALALDGWHVRFLGADTPVESVASMCIQHDAAAVAIGTSPTANANRLAEDLKVLRAAIGPDVPIWVGGRLIPLAARGTVEGLVNMAQLLERARSYRHARGLMRKGYGNK